MKIDNGGRELGFKRIETIADWHCLWWSWSYEQNISKEILENKLSQELLIINDYYKEFVTSKSIPLLVKEYINLKRYSEDDMDFLLHAVCNATKTNVILYEVHRNELRANRYTPGLVEADVEVRLFCNDQHCESLITLNQLSRPVDDTIDWYIYLYTCFKCHRIFWQWRGAFGTNGNRVSLRWWKHAHFQNPWKYKH